MQVSDILAKKSRATVTVKPNETVADLSSRLREARIGAAVVSPDGHTIVGFVSERDIAYKLSAHGSDFAKASVASIMTPTVVTCRTSDTVAAVASTMQQRNIRHIPVVDDLGKLLGMVSIRDVLNVRVEELHQETALLRTFANESLREPQDRE